MGFTGKDGARRGAFLASLGAGGAGAAPAGPEPAAPSAAPAAGSYGERALRRRFDNLDAESSGQVGEAEIKAALVKLGLPASEESVRDVLKRASGGGAPGGPPAGATVSFERFCEWAVQRERELLETFRELDVEGYGFLTDRQVGAAMRRLGYRRVGDREVRRIMRKVKEGDGAFAKGGGLLGGDAGAGAGGFQATGRAIDFAEFRDFMLLTSARDLRGVFEVWDRAVLDFGDVDVSFPLDSGKRRAPRSKRGILKHLLVGAISGGVSRSVVAPLERVKIEYMVNSALAGTEGTLGTLGRIVRTEGPLGLFKGNSLNVARIAPTKAVEFFVFDTFKDFCLERQQQRRGGGAAAAGGGRGPPGDLEPWQRMLGGSVASMAGTALTHPIDTVRTRVTVQRVSAGEALRQTLAREGPRGLLRGLAPNMVRVAPYGAINFLVYDNLKSWYRRRVGPGRPIGAAPSMLFGALAGAAAQTAVFPIELAQRRLQAQGLAGAPVLYRGMLDCIAQIVRKEGPRALYSGLLPNYGKLVPAAAVSFYLYEVLKQRFDLE